VQGFHWIVIALVLWPLSASGAEQWMLMGREGSCVTLAKAAERKAVFRGIATPDQLVARLRSQGVEVRTQEIRQGGTTVVQVDAPSRGLGLIFVPEAMCR
jgi:hypothetical protein